MLMAAESDMSDEIEGRKKITIENIYIELLKIKTYICKEKNVNKNKKRKNIYK